MDRKAQGALEYLIITAAVLAIAAVVVTVISGAFGGGKASAKVAEIKGDASDCSQALVSNNKQAGTPNETICSSICSAAKNNTNIEITTSGENAIDTNNDSLKTAYGACIAGKPSWIRQSS